MTVPHLPCEIEDEFVETPRQEGEVPFVLWPRGFVHPQNSISMDRWVDILETELIGWQLKKIMWF